jgi:(+)-trans-carveol dehydrogenase
LSAALPLLTELRAVSRDRERVVLAQQAAESRLRVALELAPAMIRVNSVHPTSVNTDMIQIDATYALFAPDLEEKDRTKENLQERFQALNALPIPWVEPVDISNAVLWLSSDESRYVTGVTLPVDAGSLIK